MNARELAEYLAEQREQERNKAVVKPTVEQLLIAALTKDSKAVAENIIVEKRRLAIAEHRQTTTIQGYIKANASVVNPLHTELEIFITDFTPNNNKQGIRRSEADNIIRTARNAPLKINYNTLSHNGANAIGTITEVNDLTDRITGKAIIWDHEYADIADYLKATAEIKTSWEIYYRDSQVDSSGVSWLTGCVFGGLCIVENPAYGSDKARAKIV